MKGKKNVGGMVCSPEEGCGAPRDRRTAALPRLPGRSRVARLQGRPDRASERMWLSVPGILFIPNNVWQWAMCLCPSAQPGAVGTKRTRLCMKNKENAERPISAIESSTSGLPPGIRRTQSKPSASRRKATRSSPMPQQSHGPATPRKTANGVLPGHLEPAGFPTPCSLPLAPPPAYNEKSSSFNSRGASNPSSPPRTMDCPEHIKKQLLAGDRDS